MASAITDYGRSAFLEMLTGIIAVPAHYWVALASREPGTGIDGTMLAALEPSALGGTVYARQSIAVDSAHWGLTGSGYVANTVPISFGVPDISWGFISYFALCDAATAGHLYTYGEFVAPQTFGPDYFIELPVGALVLRGVSVVPSIVT